MIPYDKTNSLYTMQAKCSIFYSNLSEYIIGNEFTHTIRHKIKYNKVKKIEYK